LPRGDAVGFAGRRRNRDELEFHRVGTIISWVGSMKFENNTGRPSMSPEPSLFGNIEAPQILTMFCYAISPPNNLALP
jgi:hypothetical protein